MSISLNDPGPFVVLFWTGGSEAGNWHKTLPFATLSDAHAAAHATVRMGYAAYVRTVRDVVTIGMPDGPPPLWDFKNLCWKDC